MSLLDDAVANLSRIRAMAQMVDQHENADQSAEMEAGLHCIEMLAESAMEEIGRYEEQQRKLEAAVPIKAARRG